MTEPPVCVQEGAGFFFIYGDLDGNPINLVGRPPHGEGSRSLSRAAQ